MKKYLPFLIAAASLVGCNSKSSQKLEQLVQKEHVLQLMDKALVQAKNNPSRSDSISKIKQLFEKAYGNGEPRFISSKLEEPDDDLLVNGMGNIWKNNNPAIRFFVAAEEIVTSDEEHLHGYYEVVDLGFSGDHKKPASFSAYIRTLDSDTSKYKREIYDLKY